MTPAQLYKKQDNNQVRCRLCQHFCVIESGQTGLCQARKNVDGELYSLVYGYPVAQNVDPIEKKPLFHFYPGSFCYSIGTLGCNFKCSNCQNFDLSQPKDLGARVTALDSVSPEKVVELAIAENCQSIAYTYNEPTIFFEYALDIMKIARRHGLKNVWVSNGYMSQECREAISPLLDAINIDLKSLDDDFYQDNCGARLKPVLDNIVYFKNEQVHLELTTLIIPSLSNDLDMLNKLAEFIANDLDRDTPWHISKFSPEISWHLKNLSPTGDDIIYEAYEIGKTAGLRYVYVGNLPGDQRENTYCPSCHELLVRRLGYDIERLDHGGRCPFCDHSLDIVE